MLVTRALPILRAAQLLKKNVYLSNPSVRNCGHATWNYRTACPKPPPWMFYVAEGLQGFMWWWVLWHLWTQPDHVTGEFEYPNASKWTDEELGIPCVLSKKDVKTK